MRDQYKQAGVDVEAGYEAVERMKQHVKRTTRQEVLGGLGGFGGLFDISSLPYEQPVLVSGTDGVGTKLKLAFEMARHDTIGVDAVAMCVNDIVAQGAQPLFFQDYIACGQNDPSRIEAIVKGIADGCEQAGCALIGGETAEMPGMYELDEYDLAGFVVGVVEKEKLITGDNVQAGDVLIGLCSSGIHSNGFSLVRKWLQDFQLDLHESYPGLNQTFQQTLGDVLLTPTKIYAKPVKSVLQRVEVKAISHITGGGFQENLPRMLPNNLGADIHVDSWPIPSVYSFFQEKSGMNDYDMMSIFNMGIGMVLAVAPEDVEEATKAIEQVGEQAFVIGTVTNEQGVFYR
ncbi:phosphoribosylformylglycinamidine cyclo-ligase [Pontibacillus litoralis]|uniref:Phosphoribosylformylglycinamidine cyclo-ligase n=1 Tax=Pontibacillus litoralis JSM 072002 TaxID=1385512 RepID=A0A0A5GAV2_9BACI|nr:phosphoribosylformylglycinamidine cyclo-ligase [Pontibacillus litoralis]KGX88245.1 phosphoribosylaminoimidazole synthetase [Pontibacillus litoralis JSM 072002]